MDVLDLNSMINRCTGKKIPSGNGVSDFISVDILKRIYYVFKMLLYR